MFSIKFDKFDAKMNDVVNQSNYVEMKGSEDICEKVQMEGWCNIPAQIDDPEASPVVDIDENGDHINDIGEESKKTFGKLVRTTIPINIMD